MPFRNLELPNLYMNRLLTATFVQQCNSDSLHSLAAALNIQHPVTIDWSILTYKQKLFRTDGEC